MSKALIKLAFSEKYDQTHAQQYLEKHQAGLARKLSNYRDQQLARRALALADEPNLVLDLPAVPVDFGQPSQNSPIELF